MMIASTVSGPIEALRDPVTVAVVVGVVIALVATSIGALVLGRLGRIDERLVGELLRRCGTWAMLVPLIAAPILLGRVFVVIAVALLSLGCYREFARATGLFRHRFVHASVCVGILAVAVAAALDRADLFASLWPAIVGLIVVAAVLPDRPRGYLQRTGLGVLGFALFGACLGYVSLLANEPNFRLVLIWLLLAVELNDVFAFFTGKLVGGPRLRPNTSPNKKLAAAGGALVLTTVLVGVVGRAVFDGQPVGRLPHLIALGVVISVAGQFGDLVVSSIKRDLSIKDMAAALPGHGGLLDRFDSLLLVAPAVYGYLAHVQGTGGARGAGALTLASGG